ncbi:hypothetical protein [Mesorhizobium sp. 1M-11]|uniref:hypothetical protein n=1 Tax=Mesorhizobium sp. 1M-11 TaxID=1529006 RepID=UPI0006C746DE|nr:hypothetical protein [Mesorhizobium sp. 1M-11]
MAQGLAITRGQLAKMRREAADRVQGEHHKDQLAELVRLHLAIEAIDAVLAERKIGDAKSPWDDPNFKLSR